METTIPSYLTGRPSRDLVIVGHQELTREWWDERRNTFDLYISQFVLDEAGAGDVRMAQKRLEALGGIEEIKITEEALQLVKNWLYPV